MKRRYSRPGRHPAPGHPQASFEPEQRSGPRVAVLAALALTTLACGSLWTIANRGSLAADVHEAIGIDPASLPLQCRMIGSTRSGYCRGELSQVRAEGIAARLELTASTVDLQDAASVPPLAYEGEVGCLEEDVLPGVNGLLVWWVDGRPPGLALASGAQFEYLFVVLDPVSGVGCIQVSYSYG